MDLLLHMAVPPVGKVEVGQRQLAAVRQMATHQQMMAEMRLRPVRRPEIPHHVIAEILRRQVKLVHRLPVLVVPELQHPVVPLAQQTIQPVRRLLFFISEQANRRRQRLASKADIGNPALTVYYAGGVVTKVALREPAEAPRRATASVTTLWRIRTSDPMALHVMTKKIREDDISKIGVSFAIEGRGGPARIKISREMMPLSEFLNIFGLSLNDVKNYLEE